MTTKGTVNRFRSLTVVGEPGTPATPASGDFKLYVADDGTFYVMDDTGTPTAVGGGGFSDPMTTRGDIIIRNASNVTARLGRGSAGKVLTSDGTDIAWQTPATGGALVLLEQHTASSSATLDFTSFISSTYDEYRFELVDVLAATSSVNFYVRISIGASFSSSALYGYSGWAFINGGSTTYGGATQSQILLCNASDIGNTAGGGVCGSLTLYNPAGSQAYKKMGFDMHFLDTTPTTKTSIGTALYNSTSALDGVRFLYSSGNIASGTIRVYGVAK